jgi:hypothetical protein
MLMDLAGLRAAQWKEKMVEYFNLYRWNTSWGDQDLINIFFHYFPGLHFNWLINFTARILNQGMCLFIGMYVVLKMRFNLNVGLLKRVRLFEGHIYLV